MAGREGGCVGIGMMGSGDCDQPQACGVGDNDGAQGEGVGADGGDDEASTVGREDGATAGERVGRGARGCGHDDAVAGIGSHIEVVDIDLGA